MHLIPQLIFVLIVSLAVVRFYINISDIWHTIKLGKPELFVDHPFERWKNVLLLAFGQKKLFKNPVVGILHLIIYCGFIIINLEMVEIVFDGILGTHRIFLSILGSFYVTFINLFEFLAIGVILTCIVFLIRRNLISISRFQHSDLTGSPRRDANIILLSEIILMSLFLCMNASDQVLQSLHVVDYSNTEQFLISKYLIPIFSNFGIGQLIFLERLFWWSHIIGVFVFLNYLPYSKHLHIIFAFPNAYYARLSPSGRMINMPIVQREVSYMLHPELASSEQQENIPKFGAKDALDLSWKNLLDAFSCTECGRCTQSCPAAITGKKLSPRKVMMLTRDRVEELNRYNKINSKLPQESIPLIDKIGIESIRACTTCNACVEACPVSINPVEIILELRRSLVMEDSNVPQEWNMMFNNIENNFAPWQFSPDDRDQWNN